MATFKYRRCHANVLVNLLEMSCNKKNKTNLSFIRPFPKIQGAWVYKGTGQSRASLSVWIIKCPTQLCTKKLICVRKLQIPWVQVFPCPSLQNKILLFGVNLSNYLSTNLPVPVQIFLQFVSCSCLTQSFHFQSWTHSLSSGSRCHTVEECLAEPMKQSNRSSTVSTMLKGSKQANENPHS